MFKLAYIYVSKQFDFVFNLFLNIRQTYFSFHSKNSIRAHTFYVSALIFFFLNFFDWKKKIKTIFHLSFINHNYLFIAVFRFFSAVNDDAFNSYQIDVCNVYAIECEWEWSVCMYLWRIDQKTILFFFIKMCVWVRVGMYSCR